MKALVLVLFATVCWAKKKEAPVSMSMSEYKIKVEQIVQNKVSDTKSCKTSSKGRMLVAWQVSGEGKPENFTRGEDTVQSDELYHCLVKKMSKWKFPKTPDGFPVDVEHNFAF